MSVKRKIYKSGFLHICQKTADNGILFYLATDILVFFTVLSVKAIAFDVEVFAIDFMFNHLHVGARCRDSSKVASFMNSTTSVFARLYNKRYNLRGQLFKKPFNSSPKMNESKIRDCLFYIWNNPKEKKAVELAEEYRWNFLRYLDSNHPYSKPIDMTTASENLLKSIRTVEAKRRAGEYLNYAFFDDAFKSLDKAEQQQLIDHIIVSYNVIRRDALMEMFGSYQTILTAVNAVTGNEYGMPDDYDDEDYRNYLKMIKIARREGVDFDHERFNRGYFEGKEDLLSRLRRSFKSEAGASDYEIAKFLHLL